MTFNEYLHLKGYSRKSIATIEKIVGYFKQWCDKENISDETEVSHNDMIAYIKSCTAKGVTQKTAANYVSHIKKYYDYLMKEGVIMITLAAISTSKAFKGRSYMILSLLKHWKIYTGYIR